MGVHANAETLAEMARQGGGSEPAPDERGLSFALLDIRDNVASAKIFTVGFNDYLHLVKQDGRWRIASVLWQPPSSDAVANGEADRVAVTEAVTAFVDAIAAGDVAALERVTHPEAALRMFRLSPATGEYFLIEGNRDVFATQVRLRRMPPLEDPEVAVLDTYASIASARLTTSSGLSGYFHLARQNDRWRIVNLLLR